jgi:hypothetical protein
MNVKPLAQMADKEIISVVVVEGGELFLAQCRRLLTMGCIGAVFFNVFFLVYHSYKQKICICHQAYLSIYQCFSGPPVNGFHLP